MKIPAAILALVLAAAPLLAGDWPAAFEHYEAVAIEKPGRNDATWQMWRYAVSTGRIGELKQRWEAPAATEKGLPYRLLLALLAEMETDFDGAQVQFDKAIAAAPTDANAWLLRGQMQSIRRQPESRASLEKALELELSQGLPPIAATPLAEILLTAGHPDEARSVLDKAVPAAHDPQTWLDLTEKRTEAAMAQGRLQEFLTQLETTPPAPFGGSEIAQVYAAAHDYAEATAELERARKEHPDDALLRLQALTIARAANRSSEIVRLLREETKLAPTPEKWRDLFRALVTNGEADEARSILHDQGAALFTEPLTWRELLPNLWQFELSQSIADTLAKAGDERWDAALFRGELLIAEKDRPGAEEALWSILDPHSEAQPLASGEKSWAVRPTPSQHDAAMPGAHFDERIHQVTKYVEHIPSPFNPRIAIDVDRMAQVETLTDARDLALFYLAAIAAQNQRAPEFVSKLEQRIAGWPRPERLLAWTIVQNPPHALAEMVGYAGETRTAQIDRFCREELPAIHRLQLPPEDARRADDLAKIFPAETPDAKKTTTSLDYGERFRNSNKAFRDGRFEDAWKLFTETSAAFRITGCPLAERETVACQMSFAFLLPELRDPSKTVEAAVMAIRAAFPERRLSRWPNTGEGLNALFETGTPAWSYRFFERGSGNPPRPDDLPVFLRDRLVYPPAPLFTWERVGVLWTVFGQTWNTNNVRSANAGKSPGRLFWPALKQRLDDEAAKCSGDEAFYLRTATAYLAWWNKDDDAAARMQHLLAESGDPRIGLGLVAMLNRNLLDVKVPLAVLDDLKPPTTAAARAVKAWRLTLLAESGNTTAATLIARELADAPWEIADLREILGQLQKSICSEAAATLRTRLLQEDLREEDVRQPELALQELGAPTSPFKPDALAERVLALPPPRDGAPNNARVVALQALQNSGALEGYVTKLRQACEAAPQDATARHRFAEASTGAEAATAWRKVLELEPHHIDAVRELLKLAQTSEEKRQMFEKFLALAPEEAVQEHADLFFKDYAEAHQLPHLAEAISKAPFQPAGWRAGLQSSSAWRQRAELFIDARQPEAALLVLRKAITTFDPVPSDLRRLLLFQLVALNRRDAAARELVECLAPATREASPLFAWQSPPDAPSTRNTIDVTLLKMAQTLDVTPELRARIHAAAAHDATARAVSAFLRVVDREPAALDEIRAMIPEVDTSKDTSWVVPLATELAAWPEAAAVCRELLTTYNHAVASNARYSLANRLEVARLLALTGGKDEALREGRAALDSARKNPRLSDSWRAPHAVGEIALAAGDAALLTDSIHLLVEMLETQASRSFYDTGEAIGFAGNLLDANHTGDAEQILGALRKMATARNNPSMASALAAFEMEAALQHGDWSLASPQVWLDVDESSAGQATIGWDLGTSTRFNGTAPKFVTRAESMPALAGRLVVELFVGKDADSMQPIARITDAGSRGIWRGKLPIDSGFARAVISDQDKVLFGEPCEFAIGPNLLRQADAANFLPSVPGGEVKREKHGPTVSGEYISLRAPDRSFGNLPSPSLAPQTRIKPGHDYILQAWVRTAWTRSGRLGWRCLDSSGKSVSSGSVPGFNVSDRYWIHYSQRLSWPRNNTTGQRLPPTTAFLEPTLEGGGADIAGLSLVEIPTPEPNSEP
ncbi:MAG TPA: hypothetical protein VGM54_12925 [Chthoniobacter sp.]|jgi:tetratricopeptide (TPR) repeat protein